MTTLEGGFHETQRGRGEGSNDRQANEDYSGPPASAGGTLPCNEHPPILKRDG